MFALLAVLALFGSIWALCLRPARLAPFVLWIVLFAVATLIAYARCRERGEDFAQSVLNLFVARLGPQAPRARPPRPVVLHDNQGSACRCLFLVSSICLTAAAAPSRR